MNVVSDTIFALASPPGRGAVAVIRLSGPKAVAILKTMGGRPPPPRHMSLRQLRDENGDLLDRALVVWFPSPNSYTGEDSVEFHLHGGPAVIAAVSETLIALDARPAEPGEFTRRAFLNGRLDLTAAEGIADLIAAETDAQRRLALRQAEGALRQLSDHWTTQLTRLLAQQEALIEFADDEDIPPELEQQIRCSAAQLRAEIAARLAEGPWGERLREGLQVVIIGSPNVGKSSLLNALVGREAAIVSTRAGTTRDIVEVRMILAGVPVTIADTAGLRQAADEIEEEGIRRAQRRAKEADVVLAVFAADQEADTETLAWIARGGQPVVNKIDLLSPPAAIGGKKPIAVSALTGEGLEELRQFLLGEARRLAGAAEAAVLTRPRHRAALKEAELWLAEAETAPLPELVAEALRAALRALGRLSGRVGVVEILDHVFREFCIGK